MKTMYSLLASGAIGLTGGAASAQTAAIDVFFTELSETEWEVSAEVTSGTADTSGISAFSIGVDDASGVDMSAISFSPNVLSTLTANGTVGFGAISQLDFCPFGC